MVLVDKAAYRDFLGLVDSLELELLDSRVSQDLVELARQVIQVSPDSQVRAEFLDFQVILVIPGSQDLADSQVRAV